MNRNRLLTTYAKVYEHPPEVKTVSFYSCGEACRDLTGPEGAEKLTLEVVQTYQGWSTASAGTTMVAVRIDSGAL